LIPYGARRLENVARNYLRQRHRNSEYPSANPEMREFRPIRASNLAFVECRRHRAECAPPYSRARRPSPADELMCPAPQTRLRCFYVASRRHSTRPCPGKAKRRILEAHSCGAGVPGRHACRPNAFPNIRTRSIDSRDCRLSQSVRDDFRTTTKTLLLTSKR